MLTENQEKWLNALESGAFRQATSALQDGDCFCCLGVACIVAEGQGVPVQRKNGVLFGNDLNDQPHVFNWLGLRGMNGSSSEYTDEISDSLAGMNDHGKTFGELAALIRKYPEYFFKGPEDVNPESGKVAQGS